MLTIGIDVGSQPRRTAAVAVRWSSGEAIIEDVITPVDDERLSELAASAANKVGIDVPLGWPDAFVRAVSAHHGHASFGRAPVKELVLRATDRWVWTNCGGRPPLSVSTDRIAYPAMRVARVLGDVDRSGEGAVVEVYPAAALRVWGLAAPGYKASVAGLAAACDALRCAAPWLSASSDHWSQITANGDVFDAAICSLVATAKATGLRHTIPEAHRVLAAFEGWIAIPRPDTIGQLPEACP